jgi:predicted 3-demethylubiquinone-9 3-methyltransferase (glyoxalase superfamily)
MQPISPCLWFDDDAEDAVKFYLSIFQDSKIVHIARYGESGAEVTGKPAGSVMVVDFELNGQRFTALNGGPQFSFSPAVSFIVNSRTQAEVDHYWTKLSAGGEQQPCGWLRDRYGVSWQIIPTPVIDLLKDTDSKKADRAMGALLRMTKIDIAAVEEAACSGA